MIHSQQLAQEAQDVARAQEQAYWSEVAINSKKVALRHHRVALPRTVASSDPDSGRHQHTVMMNRYGVPKYGPDVEARIAPKSFRPAVMRAIEATSKLD